MTNKPMHADASSTLFKFANNLRKEQTVAEDWLWQILRNRQVGNLKFRRQHPLGSFVLDFYCAELKLAVELDGSIHTVPENKTYDKYRTEELNNLGISVVRFSNNQVENDPDFIKHTILSIKNS